jgi:hypothetical protein
LIEKETIEEDELLEIVRQKETAAAPVAPVGQAV